jgi:hypothetical protein
VEGGDEGRHRLVGSLWQCGLMVRDCTQELTCTENREEPFSTATDSDRSDVSGSAAKKILGNKNQ